MPNDGNIKPQLNRDFCLEHPINQTSVYLINLLSDIGFTSLSGLKSKPKNITLICLISKRLILQGKCMTLFMLMKNHMY